VTELAHNPAERTRETAIWLVIAGLVGAAAGVVVGGGVDLVRVLLAIVVGILVVLVFWRYEVGAALMLLVMPLDVYGRLLTSPVTVTAFHLTLVATLASFGWHVYRRRARVLFSPVDIGMLALLAAAFISLPTSLNPGVSMFGTVRVFFLWLLVVVWSNILRTHRNMGWATALLVATGVGTTFVALAQYYIPSFEMGNILMINQGGGVYLRRVGAFFFDPNYMASFISIAFLVALGMAIHAKRSRAALVWLAATAVLAAGLFVTFSRTGYLGVAVGVVILILTAPSRRRLPILLAFVALALAAVAVAPGELTGRVASIGEVERDLSIATRYQMFYSAVDIIRDNWALGTGLGAFDVAYPPYRRLGTLTYITKPHQLPLAMWAEMGIAGLIAEIVLVVSIVTVFWRRRPRGWTAVEAFSAASIVSVMAVQSWFQYYLYFEYMWLMVAFAVAGNRLARADEEADHEL